MFVLTPSWRLVATWLIFAALTAFCLWMSLIEGALPPIGEEAEGGDETTVVIAVYALLAGSAIEWVRFRKIRAKQQSLDCLRPVFHARFPASELLSMYECMRDAPRLYWDEYANLPAVEVNEANNQRFRERVAPYRHSQLDHLQRVAIIAALVAAALAVVPTVLGYIW